LTVVRGDVAEWLRSGLQSRLHRFDSGRRLRSVRRAQGTGRATRETRGPGRPKPASNTSPATSIARFIGEVTADDAAAGKVTLHVVAVETVSGDQPEDDFDGDNVTFTFGPNATFGVTPDRTGDGAGNLAVLSLVPRRTPCQQVQGRRSRTKAGSSRPRPTTRTVSWVLRPSTPISAWAGPPRA
jgi:hypothetical protein